MGRVLPVVIALGLAVYALIDCLQTDAAEVRGPRKPVWVALIILLPLVGPIAWLVAMRHRRPAVTPPRPQRPSPPPVAPDDNPEFLRRLRDVDNEHKQMLSQWEAERRRREEEKRDRGDNGDNGHGTMP